MKKVKDTEYQKVFSPCRYNGFTKIVELVSAAMHKKLEHKDKVK